jgi:hypothetical protein
MENIDWEFINKHVSEDMRARNVFLNVNRTNATHCPRNLHPYVLFTHVYVSWILLITTADSHFGEHSLERQSQIDLRRMWPKITKTNVSITNALKNSFPMGHHKYQAFISRAEYNGERSQSHKFHPCACVNAVSRGPVTILPLNSP